MKSPYSLSVLAMVYDKSSGCLDNCFRQQSASRLHMRRPRNCLIEVAAFAAWLIPYARKLEGQQFSKRSHRRENHVADPHHGRLTNVAEKRHHPAPAGESFQKLVPKLADSPTKTFKRLSFASQFHGHTLKGPNANRKSAV